MSCANATPQSKLSFFFSARTLLGFLTLGAASLAVLVLGWSSWRSSRRSSDHWVAVARGRDYLRQGRPDLAFQSVFDVRDEAAGCGEAMAIAGLAMLEFGEYRGARLALERAIKLQPGQFDAALALAELNFALGNGRRGIEVLQIAARLRPREFQ